MGVKSLTAFVKDHFEGLLFPAMLLEWKAIVVDGNGLCHYLYYDRKCNWQLGGEYPEFFTVVKDYFSSIVKAGVEPVVIFDGSHDQKKTETVVQRKEEKNKAMKKWQGTGRPGKFSVSPILMLQTFMDALQEMNINFHIAPTEGDREVAAVANSLKCPVLSSDSDFFMYDLVEGFIPLEYFSTTSNCYVYHIDNLTAYFGWRNLKFRLFIPAILGNDIIESALKGMKIANIIKLIQAKLDYGEIIKKFGKDVEKNYRIAEEQYCEPVLMKTTSQKRLHVTTYSLPEWTFDYFLKGTFHPHLLDIIQHKCCTLGNVVEDISRKSAWSCSVSIRKHIYAFINITEPVLEYIRNDHLPYMTKKKVEIPNVPQSLSIQNFKDEDRENIVLNTLGCDGSGRKYELFNELDDKWKLPMATVVYWYRNSIVGITEDLLRSLLLCFLHCSEIRICSNVKEPVDNNFHALHAFAEWQCVYYDVMVLNNIARAPFLSTSPACLFSGRVAMFFASSSKSWNCEKCSIFKRMWDIVH